jgi:L-asparaginase II
MRGIVDARHALQNKLLDCLQDVALLRTANDSDDEDLDDCKTHTIPHEH